MLSSWMRRFAVAGIGFAALTKEKVDSLVHELVGSGEIDGEEAKELARSILKQAEEQRDEIRRIVEQQAKRLIESAGLVTKAEYEALKARVEDLEARMNEGAGSTGASDDLGPADA